jgi:ABC-2 type transport system ATP-binding protein
MGWALELHQVGKDYGSFHAVHDLTFQVPTGVVYGFLGPNGAGKTTSLRIILDILKPTRGTLSVLGAPCAHPVRHRVGYLPEEKGLYRKMTAADIIAYFASLKGWPVGSARRQALRLLERYGLKDFAHARTESLSKGMAQKVQLLASIAHEPELVVLDEPFSGLDPVNQTVMEDVIADIRRRGGTVVFCTHVMTHAERLCDRLLILAGGRQRFEGSVEDARNLLPWRVRLDAGASGLEALFRCPCIAGHRMLTEGGHEVVLHPGSGPDVLLEACFNLSVRLRRFDTLQPTLHEAFVHLVGMEARNASLR